MGTSDLPDIYARARGPLIYSIWVTHLQVLESVGLFREYIYIGLC